MLLKMMIRIHMLVEVGLALDMAAAHNSDLVVVSLDMLAASVGCPDTAVEVAYIAAALDIDFAESEDFAEDTVVQSAAVGMFGLEEENRGTAEEAVVAGLALKNRVSRHQPQGPVHWHCSEMHQQNSYHSSYLLLTQRNDCDHAQRFHGRHMTQHHHLLFYRLFPLICDKRSAIS